jgi:hypothetical protein
LGRQLTQPVISLVPAGALAPWRARLPWRTPGVTRARFGFDTQGLLQRSPVELTGGGDSSTAMAALLAYPLFLLRLAVRSHLLDFRLPDYSGRPVIDGWPADGTLALRAKPSGASEDVRPERTTLTVRRGMSSSDDGTEDGSLVELPLWRYRRPAGERWEPVEGTWCGRPVRRVKSVLLMHAFAMSGSTFTLRTVDQNFAEYLYRQGYEVWILDTRMSPRVGGSARQGTLDQVGLIDAPAAVEHILATLAQATELGGGAPLQIFSFAHCMGSAAMLVGLLSGKLSYEPHGRGTEPMPKLAGLVCSQVHPFMVGSRRSQAKTWIPAFVRDVAARTAVPLAVRKAEPTLAESLMDRIFAALPVPPAERCPHEATVDRGPEDDCATCRRIRFLDGDLFKHSNLNSETHELLPTLFGDGVVRLFAQGARMVEHERLVTEDGLNAYATDDAIGRYLALPIRFVHGADNDLFDRQSAERSANQFKRLQPAWSDQFAPAGKSATAQENKDCADIIEGYGHLDGLIGNRAHQEVYPRLGALFDAVLREVDQPVSASPVSPAEWQARFPRLGPWLGPVRETPAGRCLDVAFMVDDMRAEAAAGVAAGLQASALVHGLPGHATPLVVPLAIGRVATSLVARDGFLVGERRQELLKTRGINLVRVAKGTIDLPAGPLGAVHLECVSHTLAVRGPIPDIGMVRGTEPERRFDRFDRHGTPLDGELKGLPPELLKELFDAASPIEIATETSSVESESFGPRPSETELRDAIHRAVKEVEDAWRRTDRPFPPTHSQIIQRPISPCRRFAFLGASLLQPPQPADEVRWALGCCRYPGFPFDRARAEESFRRLLALQRGPVEQRVRLGLMLGDQIYADATAGFLDPLNAIERYVDRHVEAFGSRPLQRLMARLPMVMCPDDHEFGDNYPNGTPLFGGTAIDRQEAAVRNEWRRRVATDACRAFQQSAFPLNEGGGDFEMGDIRCLVLDTRTDRHPTRGEDFALLTQAQWDAIETWLASPRAAGCFHVICTGSVVWPALLADGDPGNRGPADSWQLAVSDRRRLLHSLVTQVPRRFALVSGDYHVSLAGTLAYQGQPVGACIVAPPFYAPLPYANAAAHEVDWRERLDLPQGPLRLCKFSPVLRGSGYGVLGIQRQGHGWQVRYSADLLDMETGADWTGLKPVFDVLL